MKYTKMLAVAVVLAMTCMLSINISAVSDHEWANLEQKYYAGSVRTRGLTATTAEESKVLRGSTLDSSKFVQSYAATKDVLYAEQLEEVVSEIRSGKKIADMITAENLFLSVASGNADPIPGTAVIQRDGSSYQVIQILEGDRGTSFSLNLSSERKQAIQESGLDVQNADVKFIRFDGYLTAILISDDNLELLLPITSVYEDLSPKDVLTAAEFADHLESVNAKLQSLVNP